MKKSILALLMILLSSSVFAQKKITIKGDTPINLESIETITGKTVLSARQ